MRILQNQTIEITLDFINKSLGLTIIWIVLYLNILTLLNFLYPPVVNDIFYRPAAVAPERFEMLLYLLLTFLFAIIILVSKKINFLTLNLRLSHKIIILVFLLVLFLTKLGSFPLANDFYPYEPRSDYNFYYLILTLYLFTISLIIIEGVILSFSFKHSSFLTYILFIFIIFIIGIFTFEARFPISSFDYTYFFGPIWDVSSGKTIFTQVNSDYGFISVLFFAFLHKLKLFDFPQLAIYVWLMFVTLYFLCFYLIYKVSRSMTLSLIGLFSAVTVNYYSFFILPITITQYSAQRRLPAVLLLLLLYYFKKIDSKLFLIITSFFAFWIIDAGIQIYLALALTLFFLLLAKYLNFRRLLSSILILGMGLFSVLIFINIVHVIFGYRAINFLQALTSIKQYASQGLTMIAMPSHSFFWIVILVYLSSVSFVFQSKNISTIHQIILLSANLTFFNSLYYVGRSHDANLLDISVLVILNMYLLIGSVWQHVKIPKLKYVILAVLFLFTIAFPAYQRRYTLAELILKKYSRLASGNIFKPEMTDFIDGFFSKEKQLIAKYFKEKDILILARDDTYLYISSGKRALLRVNPQSAIDSTSEMEFSVKDVEAVCPKKIAVECTLYEKCPTFTSYTARDFFMAKQILQTVEEKCKLKYQPIECTNKLCIAKSQ